MSSTPTRATPGSEDWRLKVLTDAIGNALGTGLAGAVALLYGAATGIIRVEQRRIFVSVAVLILAITWSLVLWSSSSRLENKLGSRRLANVIVWGGGQLFGFLVLALILYITDNDVSFAFWATLFGFAIVFFINVLDILHR